MFPIDPGLINIWKYRQVLYLLYGMISIILLSEGNTVDLSHNIM